MDTAAQLKGLAPFLDMHLMHHLLKKNAEKQSVDLCTQIKAKFLSADKTGAAKREADALKKA